jgi:hypothetical protein
LRVLEEGLQEEAHLEKVLLTQIQVLATQTRVDEGAYTKTRVSLKPQTDSETYLG